ncbi:MAG TPA: YciI family protein [Micromonosporaceae bacterium]
MIFMFLFYSDERVLAAMSREERNGLVERHTAYNHEVLEKRVTVLATRGLQPTHTAYTVRPRNGQTTVRPGPFASTSESLAGFYLVDCRDLDEALELARTYPMPEGAGCIEVRPVMTEWDYGPTAVTTASPELVWRVYADLAGWPSWQAGVTGVTLDGPLKGGASGRIKLADQSEPVPFRIVSATENQGFVSEIEFTPGVMMRTEHLLESPRDGGTRVVHRANVPRAVLDAFGLEYGPLLYSRMRESVKALTAVAERALS